MAQEPRKIASRTKVDTRPRQHRRWSIKKIAGTVLPILAISLLVLAYFNGLIPGFGPSATPAAMATTEIPDGTPEPISTEIAVTETANPPTMEPTASPIPTATQETEAPTVVTQPTATQAYDRVNWIHITDTTFQLNGSCFSKQAAERWEVWVLPTEGGYTEGCDSSQTPILIWRLTTVPTNMAIRPKVDLPTAPEERLAYQMSNFDRSLSFDVFGKPGYVTVCAVNTEIKNSDGKYIKTHEIVVLREGDETIVYPREGSADLEDCYFVKPNYVRKAVLYFISTSYDWILWNKAQAAGYEVKFPALSETEAFSGLWLGDLSQAVFPEKDPLSD